MIGTRPEGTKVMAASTQGRDPRIQAFCAPAGPEVFHSVSHRHEIWKPDPLDVDSIHASAREVFGTLVQRATTPGMEPPGRILLLWGESGSGKTHLMRAFRNDVHANRLGYCGYLQMTTAASDYARYLLSNLLESLDQPYYAPESDLTGLMRLANAAIDTPAAILPKERQQLREAAMSDAELAQFINYLADNLMEDDRFSRAEVDVVRALLYLQRGEARIKSRILKFLRCEDLSPHDRRILGDVVPRCHDDDPARIISTLAQLARGLQSACLVVCIDQLEEMYNLANAAENFRRAMGAIRALADRLPGSVFVISCLEDFYQQLRGHLTNPVRDRLEHDPKPIRLLSERSCEEVQALVQLRLERLYEASDVRIDPSDPTFPFPLAELAKLRNLRTRDVIDWCRDYRDRCIAAGGLIGFDAEPAKSATTSPPPELASLSQQWDDFRAGFASPVPDEDAALVRLLAKSIQASAAELSGEVWFAAEADAQDPPCVEVAVQNQTGVLRHFLVGLCNKDPRGGGLSRQIEAVNKRAGEHTAVIVRSTPFPLNPAAQVAKQLAELIRQGGRRAVIEDSHWRTMLAFEAFRTKHQQDAAWKSWLRDDQPLTSLKPLQDILTLDQPVTLTVPAAASTPAMAETNAAAPISTGDEPLLAGMTTGRTPAPVTLTLQELTQHAAFLGGSGSGKTTLALNLIEQLLLRGVPAVLLDRKGDLCGYALPRFWTTPLSNREQEVRRDRLRRQVDVVLYTPGHPAGNPLSIPIVPGGLAALHPHEREEMAHHAAFALGGMMGYKTKGQDASRIAILKKAIDLLAVLTPDRDITLDDLIGYIDEADDALVNAIGKLDRKLNTRLVQDLETRRINCSNLLAAGGARLETERLLGLGPNARPGKVRLSIISTKFLGDASNVDFWVAQLLLEVGRWASRNPAKRLQAVFLFDEADQYLPAMRQPATKGPMENLLKRARSAGIGLFLASQSPGDFDYKCRDNIRSWFAGRITQETSLAKLRPVLSDGRADAVQKLPGLSTGQFFLARERTVVGLQAQGSLLATEQLAEEEILNLARKSQ